METKESSNKKCTRYNDNHVDEFAEEVREGLSRKLKYLPSKYIYDDRGSRLFQDIMALPEYYLTGCEEEILTRHRAGIAEHVSGDEFNLVELGAGDGLKTKILLQHFLNRDLNFTYVPIDISEKAVRDLVRELEDEFSELSVQGLVTDYFEGLSYISGNYSGRNMVLFLGSNIGNFDPGDRIDFLAKTRGSLSPEDYVLIGFDLKKNIDVVKRAYDDSRGVTAEFNLNLLRRINLELGGDFDLNAFKFYSTWDARAGAIISTLVSLKKQTVHVDYLERDFEFMMWEPIHTESSYKFNEEDIRSLADRTGFTVADNFHDTRGYFVDSLWQVDG